MLAQLLNVHELGHELGGRECGSRGLSTGGPGTPVQCDGRGKVRPPCREGPLYQASRSGTFLWEAAEKRP